MVLGLKCSIDEGQFRDRLARGPGVLEFHLWEYDLIGDRLALLESRIEESKDRGIQVYLHQPIKYRRKTNNMISGESERELYYNLSTEILIRLCKKHDISVVVHPSYNDSEVQEYTKEVKEKLKNRIQYFNEESEGRILWENASAGLFIYSNEQIIEDIVKPLGLNICMDISHLYISTQGDNDKTLKIIKGLQENIQYYHVVDSFGKKHDSLQLGKGTIQWERYKRYIEKKPYIFEIDLKNQEDCEEMVKSYEYFRGL